MKLGSLFDGSGGFPLAGAIHDITPVWASEIEPYPIKVTKARFPQMKHLGSVLDVNGAEIEPVDIITFGSPCQDLSVAGKQAGLHKGERSNLFFEAIRIIKEMRRATNGTYPRIAVWENVPGAYSSNKGEDFRAVLQAFCSVKDEAADVPRPATGKWNSAGAIVGNGWSIAWRTFDAQYWGVPQRRKRIYLIADFGSERAGEVLFEQDRVPRDFAESGTAGEGAAGDAAGSAGGSLKCLTPWDVQSKRIYQEDSKWPGLCTGKRICDGSVLTFSAGDAERGVGGGCEPVGFQSSQSGFRLCATHATLDANNGSRRQNGVCYPAPGGAEGGVGRSGAICFQACGDRDNPSISTSDKAYCLPANPMSDRGQAVCFQQNQREEVRDMGDKTGAIAANSGAHQTNYVCAFMGGQGDRARSIAWTEEATPPLKAVPSGSNTVPTIVFKERAGCPGGGKGILCGDKPFTLSTLTDQAVCYPIDLIRESRGAFEAYEEDADKAGALKQCDNKRSQVVCYAAGFKAGQSKDASLGYQEECAATLSAQASGTEPTVCYALQGNGIDRADTAGCNGAGWREDEMYTLNTIVRPAVCYSVDCRNMNLTKEHGTLQAKENGGQSLNYMGAVCYPIDSHQQDSLGAVMTFQNTGRGWWNEGKTAQTLRTPCGGDSTKANLVLKVEPAKPPRRYIIRRLTPLECCRLQGFPDWWEHLAPYNPADADFWEEVRKTHAEINGKAYKPVKNIKKWYDELHADSARYKMWGNGIALPNAAYVVGCAVQLLQEGKHETDYYEHPIEYPNNV